MLKSRHVVIPVIIGTDGQEPTDEDMAVLNGIRLELMDWWAAFGHGMLILEPLSQRRSESLASFMSDPWGIGKSIVAERYPVASNPDLTVLYAIKGIDSRIITTAYAYSTTSYGAGWAQFALAAWDLVEGAKVDESVRRRLMGLCAHELGHAALGWQHDYQTPHNIMGYAWWNFPAAGMPAPSGTTFRMLSAGETPSIEACPISPVEG